MEFNATFIAAMVSFGIFTVIMNSILYKPIGKILAERKNFVDEHYNEATEVNERAQSLLNDKEKKLEQTKFKAKKIISEKAENAKQQKNVVTAQAHNEAVGKIAEAKVELQKETAGASEVLSDQVINLAGVISSKILGEEIPVKTADKTKINDIMQG